MRTNTAASRSQLGFLSAPMIRVSEGKTRGGCSKMACDYTEAFLPSKRILPDVAYFTGTGVYLLQIKYTYRHAANQQSDIRGVIGSLYCDAV
jgi:hypothetical protein